MFESLAIAGLIMERGELEQGGLPPIEPTWRDVIVHRDLKISNIFLGTPLNDKYRGYPAPKLADFGLTVMIPKNDKRKAKHFNNAGTILARPPEQVDYAGIPSSATNVWGAGSVIWGLIELQEGDDSKANALPWDDDKATAEARAEARNERETLDVTDEATDVYSPELIKLVRQCLHFKQGLRLDFWTLLKRIRRYTSGSAGSDARTRGLRDAAEDHPGFRKDFQTDGDKYPLGSLLRDVRTPPDGLGGMGCMPAPPPPKGDDEDSSSDDEERGGDRGTVLRESGKPRTRIVAPRERTPFDRSDTSSSDSDSSSGSDPGPDSGSDSDTGDKIVVEKRTRGPKTQARRGKAGQKRSEKAKAADVPESTRTLRPRAKKSLVGAAKNRQGGARTGGAAPPAVPPKKRGRLPKVAKRSAAAVEEEEDDEEEVDGDEEEVDGDEEEEAPPKKRGRTPKVAKKPAAAAAAEEGDEDGKEEAPPRERGRVQPSRATRKGAGPPKKRKREPPASDDSYDDRPARKKKSKKG